MNRKQLLTLVVSCLVIGALGLFIVYRQASEYTSTGETMGQKLLPDFPMNDVAHIRVVADTNELNLVRTNETWRIREGFSYPADFTKIGDLLRKLWDMKVAQSETGVGPSQLPRLQLAEPGPGTNTATLLEFKDASDQTVAALLLGKKHLRQPASPGGFGSEGWPDGRYVMRQDRPGDVALVSDALSEVEPEADRWFDKEFFKIDKLEAVSVTHTNGETWSMTRDQEGGDWQLADLGPGEELDTSKISFLNYLLSSPYFNDVVDPNTPPAELGLDQPTVARLDTFEGFHYTLQFGAAGTNDNYALRVSVSADYPRTRTAPEDEKEEDKERLEQEFQEQLDKLDAKLKKEQSFEPWTYRVSKWTVENLLKTRKDFIKEKKTEEISTPADTSAISTPPPDLIPDPLVPILPRAAPVPPPPPEGAVPPPPPAPTPAQPAPAQPDAEPAPASEEPQPPAAEPVKPAAESGPSTEPPAPDQSEGTL